MRIIELIENHSPLEEIAEELLLHAGARDGSLFFVNNEDDWPSTILDVADIMAKGLMPTIKKKLKDNPPPFPVDESEFMGVYYCSPVLNDDHEFRWCSYCLVTDWTRFVIGFRSDDGWSVKEINHPSLTKELIFS